MGHGAFFERKMHFNCMCLRRRVGVLSKGTQPSFDELVDLSSFVWGE